MLLAVIQRLKLKTVHILWFAGSNRTKNKEVLVLAHEKMLQ